MGSSSPTPPPHAPPDIGITHNDDSAAPDQTQHAADLVVYAGETLLNLTGLHRRVDPAPDAAPGR